MDTTPNTTPPKTKPSWLESLETESWQAELIVSGVAIYGSLQLPGLINRGIDWSLLHVGGDALVPLYFIFWYLMIATAVLILNFIAHFALRALWIGTVGLASVFPQGIRDDSTHYSQDFLRRVREEFPDITRFNESLDRLCSQFFAFSFAFVMMFLSFSIILLLGLLLASLIHLALPGVPLLVVYIGLMGIVLLPGVFSSVFNTRSLREKAWVQRIHFPILRLWGRVIFNMSYQPIYYIIYTFTTNAPSMSRFGAVFGAYLMLIMVLAVPMLIRSNALLLQSPVYFRLDERSDRVYAAHYEDEAGAVTRLRPTIPSATISGRRLRLFLPMPQREDAALAALCGAYIPADSLGEDENRRRRRAHRLDCLNRYFTISIDGRPCPNLSYRFYDHANAGEPGVLTSIPTDSLDPGEHVLRIVYAFTDEEGQARESNIPFWFEDEN